MVKHVVLSLLMHAIQIDAHLSMQLFGISIVAILALQYQGWLSSRIAGNTNGLVAESDYALSSPVNIRSQDSVPMFKRDSL